MERKVNAYIELRANDRISCLQNDYSSNDLLTFSISEVISCYYEYPLKIMIPLSLSETSCQWIYPITFGGGLVEGDYINMSVKIGNNCCVLMTTLSFTKVYCCENGLDSQQHVKYDVCSHALLCVLPDPLVCYKKASYIQTQSYYISSDANVVSLDWFTSGRYERGECWDFTKLKCVSTFYMNNKLVFKEAQNLQNSSLLNIKKAMKSYNCFGTCIIIGPYLSFLFEKILSQLGKCHDYGEKYQADTLFAVSPLHLKGVTKPAGCIVRFAAESVSKAIRKIEELLEPLIDVLGENPFHHK